MPVVITALGPHVGVQFTGLTGSELVDNLRAEECLKALDRYGVVIYRDAHISDQDLVAFSRLLGDVVANPTGEHELTEIATITLDPAKTDPRLAWYREGNFLWHIDGATDLLPQRATLLTARQTDPAGGDTEFATTYAAYELLSEAEKAAIDDLRVVHSFSAAQRRAHPDADEKAQAAWAAVPVREHPLVWHRRDGRRSLLLGATADYVVGWPEQEGRALLDRLLTWCTRPEFTLRHKWHVGDLVIWDNTGMLHHALPFAPTSLRLMHRTTLVGTEPVAAA
jgi:alpha-ketoglutarate-dependent taurine dioxygenase